MKSKLQPGFVLALLTAMIFISCGKRETPKDKVQSLTNCIEIIKFDPEGAVDFPFDSLFKSVEAIKLMQEERRDYEFFNGIERVDSFLIVNGMKDLRLFDLKGRFVRRIEMPGNDPDVLKNLSNFFPDNESITSIYGQNWIKFSLNGSVLGKGKITNKLNWSSFIPLEDSLWLFYSPSFKVGNDTFRLWTSDQDFNVKMKFNLSNSTNSSFLTMEKCIHKTSNGIYITDIVTDTIYKFTENEVLPVYVFDFGNFIPPRKHILMSEPEVNEVVGQSVLVTTNAVLFRVVMNKTKYLIYYDRNKKISRTIKSFDNELDTNFEWAYMGSDQNDRLYWMLQGQVDKTIEIISKKYNYPDLLNRNKGMEGERMPWIIITTLR